MNESSNPHRNGPSKTGPEAVGVQRIDIDVVTYNSKQHVGPLVESIAASARPSIAIHLHFVDNASEDGTVDHLRKVLDEHRQAFAEVTVEENLQNVGFGRAQNQAAERGEAPLIFILNPDTILSPKCLQRLVEGAANSGGDVAAWEPRQVPYEHPKVYDPVSLETSWCSGAALLVRRDAFERVGGFDPKIFLYCEDVDLSWRMRAAGFRLLYLPSAVVTHNTYSRPEEIKPAQFVNTRIGALYLRTRFGRWRDIFAGLVFYCFAIAQSQRFAGQRLALLRGLFSYARNFWHFRRGAFRRHGKHRFYGWDFAPARGGAFHRVTPYDELSSHPKVSVLVRTLGNQTILYRALKSIENQTYRNIEAIVVEDGPRSLDEFLSGFTDLQIVYRPQNRNRGRSRAGNEALKEATGDFCVFLDDDDEFFADHVEQLVSEVIRTNCQVAYTTAFEVATQFGSDHDIQSEADTMVAYARPFSQVELCFRNFLPIQSVLFCRSLFERCGGFDTELDSLEDWDLWLRYSLVSGPFSFVDKTTSLFRVPRDRKDFGQRHVKFGDDYDSVLAKHEGLQVTMGVDQVAREAQRLVEGHNLLQQIIGISPGELRGVQRLKARHRAARHALNLARPAIRRLLIG